MKIQKMRVSSLKPYENNAKIHTPEQIDQIRRSILDFGFNDPIAVDETGMIIEGHGRLLAVQAMGWEEVDCIVLEGLTEDQKRAYIHVHNQLTMNTGFDLDILEQELKSIQGFDMGVFGFDLDFDLESDFTFDDGESAQAEVTAAAEKKDPRTKQGQLWKLGKHRLMVGDSTSKADVDRLTEGKKMDLCLTDPPYNVALGHSGSAYEAQQRHRRTDGLLIMNDDMEDGEFHEFLRAFYEQMLRVLKPGASFYIFHADSEGLNFRSALRAAGGQLRQSLVWVKNAMTLGRQDYQWKHEPILYGWKDGKSHYFVNDRCQTTVFETRTDIAEMPREELEQYAEFLQAQLEAVHSTVVREKRPNRSVLHPTMKPVALCGKLIQNSTKRGGRVIDFFGGSGSTLMACEETGRVCYAMELDPRYADVIISRWEDSTGEKAVLLDVAE